MIGKLCDLIEQYEKEVDNITCDDYEDYCNGDRDRLYSVIRDLYQILIDHIKIKD